MFDIWGLILQTLSISGVAVLLLVIKSLFKDKLPPKWHFAVWSVLAVVMFIPAGVNGRYILFNWHFVIEFIKMQFGDYSIIRVFYPFPVLNEVPNTIAEWIFAGYAVGIILSVIKYIASYIWLRMVLRNGENAGDEMITRINRIALTHKVKVKRVIAVSGIPSAFVCGILRPVLVIPANEDIDDKVLLHELLHMKYRDNLWNVVICLIRCLQWCNPIIIYCANQALNDMEARCDQHVLEILEGEERREYGKILLSMVNDRFAKIPGSTCINNGGKKIKKRIETIARFKLYPAGMRLASVCTIIMLSFSLFAGVQDSKVYESKSDSIWLAMASARTTPCTTPAGAFDTYAKAVLMQKDVYRMMCSPNDMHEEIINKLKEEEKTGCYMYWDTGLQEVPDWTAGYSIYNLTECDNNTYEGLLVIKLEDCPYEECDEDDEDEIYYAIQKLRALKESGRWVIKPLSEFAYVETDVESPAADWPEIPSVLYAGTYEDFRVEIEVQTMNMVENSIQNSNDLIIFGDALSFDTIPKPNAEFTKGAIVQCETVIYLGAEEDREKINKIGVAHAPVYIENKLPESYSFVNRCDSLVKRNSDGKISSSKNTEKGWGPAVTFDGNETRYFGGDVYMPEYLETDLYVNDGLVTQMDLVRQEVVQ